MTEDEANVYIEKRGGARILVVENPIRKSLHNMPALIAAAMAAGLTIVYRDEEHLPPPIPTPIAFDDLPRPPRARRAAHRGTSLLELMHGLGARTKTLWTPPTLEERNVCDNCDGAPDGGHTGDIHCIYYENDR